MHHDECTFKPYYFAGHIHWPFAIRQITTAKVADNLFILSGNKNSVALCSMPDENGQSHSIWKHDLHSGQVSSLLSNGGISWHGNFGLAENSFTSTPLDTIISGAQDSHIIGWNIESGLEFVLEYHTSNVSCLAAWSGGIISGSWDKTIAVWGSDGKLLRVLKGHTEGVLCICTMQQGKNELVLSGSGDRRILRWDLGLAMPTYEYKHHKDSIRDLISAGKDDFWSCGNDCCIYKVNLNGDILVCLQGHHSFVYKLSLLDNGGIISASEDRTVRIWMNGKISQIIYHPNTVWSIATLHDGYFATACADGGIRFWSVDQGSCILLTAENELRQMVASCEIPCGLEATLTENLPGSDLPSRPGEFEGQVAYTLQDSSKKRVYCWSQNFNCWNPVGYQCLKKAPFKESEELTFSIEIAGQVLQLHFGKNENPEAAALQFIRQNASYGLNASHLDSIVSFIKKNCGNLDDR